MQLDDQIDENPGDEDAEGHLLPSTAHEREGGVGRAAPDRDDDVQGHVNFRPLDNDEHR